MCAPVGWGIVSTNHELRLYNSLGRRMEDFVPAAEVAGLYSCGPTVYAYPHLGNMRAYVFADTLRRALRWKGIGVRHVVNITDVGHAVDDTETGEDKLEVAAARERPGREAGGRLPWKAWSRRIKSAIAVRWSQPRRLAEASTRSSA